ncbi:Rv3235 family protein [Mycobacterium sp. 236(2023)]|uniref:Rv3235 family protein n=1 Tax=Mycobacterium sp. 236(2023) TaxID=3038163 RepID=UPI0024152FB9|nr:Rv3235 family protein [Mycobacterium sp. 236(2023)]MDG4664298.1 Rv3235 family protein [Mycobacterium sp. 236(2023)]
MSSSPVPSDVPSAVLPPAAWTTSPIIDYEPAPHPFTPRPCPTPSGAALHRPSPHTLRAPRPAVQEIPPPQSAVVFAESALRRVIEVIDRRRPISQLRPLMTPFLIDCVIARSCAPRTGSAALRRVRVRSVHAVDVADEVTAAEVFASFTRSGRVHAVAGRIERYRDSWRLVALQIG